MRRLLIASLAAAALAGPSAALADQPPDAGCEGRIVATLNHLSGLAGASGNPNASAGPGYFLKQDTAEAVLGVKDASCP
jgi:hypothetical protein